MEQIRVSSNVKRIQVNENGDYITLNLGDVKEIERYQNVVSELGKVIDGLDEAASLEEKISACKSAAENIDTLFGKGSSMKIFGTDTPYPDMIGDFFHQLTPIIAKCVNERKEKITSKYSTDRKKR